MPRLDRIGWLAVSLWFLASPLRPLVQGSGYGTRFLIIYVIVAPLIGLLLLFRHRRARFAAYVFLTMDIVRSAVSGAWPFLALDLAVLLFLQTPMMRRVYPRIDAAQVRDRWRRRPSAL
jgi:hypothetical protein